MKNIALGILIVIFFAVLVEPMVETANVCREKIILGSAISSACRAAKDRSLEYEKMRDLDALVDKDLFMDYFSDAFEDALNLSLDSKNGSALTFSPNDDKYNDFSVEMTFSDSVDFDTEQIVSEVKIHVSSKYKFKTKFLRLSEKASGVSFVLVSDRKLILYIRN